MAVFARPMAHAHEPFRATVGHHGAGTVIESTSSSMNTSLDSEFLPTQTYLPCDHQLMKYLPIFDRLTVTTYSSSDAADYSESSVLEMRSFVNTNSAQQYFELISSPFATQSGYESSGNKLCGATAASAAKINEIIRTFRKPNNEQLTTTQRSELVLASILEFMLNHHDSNLDVCIQTGDDEYKVYIDAYNKIKHLARIQQYKAIKERLAVIEDTDYVMKKSHLQKLMASLEIDEFGAKVSKNGSTREADQRKHQINIPNPVDRGFYKFEIFATSQEYQTVIDQLFSRYDYYRSFASSNHSCTVKISKIRNLTLLTQYEAQKRKVQWSLTAENSELPAERILFHSTDKGAADKICREEFNRSFAGSAYGTSYGAGAYFGTREGVAAFRGECVFMARVLTGKFYKGNRSVSRVNLSPTFHSTVDNVENPTVFVVYHDAAACPEYLIELTAAIKYCKKYYGSTFH
ncbi:uncharacterized protein [Watersipora subatra]|uniref:uncharacterized protein n=1 Tax=Watersipora subatra TaxID=2589382 RepID=UPI00355B1799